MLALAGDSYEEGEDVKALAQEFIPPETQAASKNKQEPLSLFNFGIIVVPGSISKKH